MDFSPLLRSELIEKRDYQISIADSCVKGNTLVVLPTALGKTVIAILAISKLIENGGKAIFVAPTRPLVHQHRSSLIKFLKLNEDEICELNGSIPKQRRKELYRTCRIIISTPQVIENDLEFLTEIKDQFKVLVIDEAHRAIGNYSYVHIAESFKDSARIIAMTASPGGDVKKINQIMNNLGIQNLEIRDENSPDVKQYIEGIEVKWINVDIPVQMKRAIEKIREMLNDKLEKLNNFGFNLKGNSRKELIEIGETISLKIREGDKRFYSAARLRSQAIALDLILEFAETQGLLPLIEYLKEHQKDEKTNFNSIINSVEFRKLYDELISLSKEPMEKHTPKIPKILELISMNNVKTIVFCHYRITATILSNLLNKNGISSERFIGQSDRLGDKGLKQSQQKEILERFREGSFKVLVATQVGEEGLDVPYADMVIFYEPVPSEIRSIQRRGRTGRFSKGLVYILVTKGTRDYSYLYSARRKEFKMKTILKGQKKQHKLDEFL